MVGEPVPSPECQPFLAECPWCDVCCQQGMEYVVRVRERIGDRLYALSAHIANRPEEQQARLRQIDTLLWSGLTQREVAQRLGVTRQRLSQIVRKYLWHHNQENRPKKEKAAVLRVCRFCGKTFEVNKYHHRYCSKECYRSRSNEYHKRWIAKSGWYQKYMPGYLARPGVKEHQAEYRRQYYRRPEVRERYLARRRKRYHDDPVYREKVQVRRREYYYLRRDEHAVEAAKCRRGKRQGI